MTTLRQTRRWDDPPFTARLKRTDTLGRTIITWGWDGHFRESGGEEAIKALEAYGRELTEENSRGQMFLSPREVAQMIEDGGSRTESGKTIAQHGILIIIRGMTASLEPPQNHEIIRRLLRRERKNPEIRQRCVGALGGHHSEAVNALGYISQNAPDPGTRIFAEEQLKILPDVRSCIRTGNRSLEEAFDGFYDGGLMAKPLEARESLSESKFVVELSGMIRFFVGIQLTRMSEPKGPME